jgi:hypothetical protein
MRLSIKIACDEAEVEVPHILLNLVFYCRRKWWCHLSNFVSKQQNDREKWNMIDSSLLLLYLILGQSTNVLLCWHQSLE